jgi:hypothetical protein
VNHFFIFIMTSHSLKELNAQLLLIRQWMITLRQQEVETMVLIEKISARSSKKRKPVLSEDTESDEEHPEIKSSVVADHESKAKKSSVVAGQSAVVAGQSSVVADQESKAKKSSVVAGQSAVVAGQSSVDASQEPKAKKSAVDAGQEPKAKQKRAKKRKFGDPKKPLSAYMFFMKHERPNVVQLYPDAKFTDIGTLMGRKWSQMNEMEKRPYLDLAAEDKVRYSQEMAALGKPPPLESDRRLVVDDHDDDDDRF